MTRTSSQRRQGFTLLEVLLAIALSATLLALLVAAINQFLFRVDDSRKYIEEAQVARGVLEMIAQDLRSMAVAYEQDISSAASNSEAQALFDVDETDAEPHSGSSSSDASSMTGDQTYRPYLGVSGDLLNLQVDVLRVRPVYTLAEDTEEPAVLMSIASDAITSVRYQLTEEGLVRQEVGRDQSLRADQQGLPQIWEETSRLVGPEVADLRFRYLDGLEAFEFWDLEEQQGVLPIAVEVRIGLRPASVEETSDPPLHYYRLTVALPAAQDDSQSAASDTDAGGSTQQEGGG
ncbi:MAG: prepilin-type N-terminal cleavage/methylation domain-containing protein [Planctomycetales bacterium]|nr:prepilin-type N-terminal cleavage/methylation domain-containing protein [Planctomycetales bacterium]